MGGGNVVLDLVFLYPLGMGHRRRGLGQRHLHRRGLRLRAGLSLRQAQQLPPRDEVRPRRRLAGHRRRGQPLGAQQPLSDAPPAGGELHAARRGRERAGRGLYGGQLHLRLLPERGGRRAARRPQPCSAYTAASATTTARRCSSAASGARARSAAPPLPQWSYSLPTASPWPTASPCRCALRWSASPPGCSRGSGAASSRGSTTSPDTCAGPTPSSSAASFSPRRPACISRWPWAGAPGGSSCSARP